MTCFPRFRSEINKKTVYGSFVIFKMTAYGTFVIFKMTGMGIFIFFKLTCMGHFVWAIHFRPSSIGQVENIPDCIPASHSARNLRREYNARLKESQLVAAAVLCNRPNFYTPHTRHADEVGPRHHYLCVVFWDQYSPTLATEELPQCIFCKTV